MKKSHQMLVLGLIAGGVGTYLLIRSGMLTGQVKLGQTGPYHDFGPAPTGGIPKYGFVPASAISGAAKIF